MADAAGLLAFSSRSSAVGIDVEAGANLSAALSGEAGMLDHNCRIEVSAFMVAHDS
jgi:hypothetical protein